MANENEWSDFDFKLCTSATELIAVYNLRLEVFHGEQKFPKETEIDSYDPISAHFIVISKKDNDVVATVRLSPYPLSNQSSTSENSTSNADEDHGSFPLGDVRSETEIVEGFLRSITSPVGDNGVRGAKLSRLAVKKTTRGKGIGCFTVKEAENWLLRTLSGKINLQEFAIILSSQMQAKVFYEKIGYICHGEPYDEEGMLHILCRKQFTI